MEVDLISGRPVEEVKNAKQAKKDGEEASLRNDVKRGMEIEDKLKTPDGEFFIGLIRTILENRIDQLVENDAQCQTVINVLTGLGQQISAGKYAAKRIMENRLRFGVKM